MSDHDALLRAILEFPAEDTPRLMYADWCDENNDPDRAAFIRAQIELARLPVCDVEGGIHCDTCSLPTGRYRYTKRCRGEVCKLRVKEYYSSRQHIVWDWTNGIPRGTYERWGRGFVFDVQLSADEFAPHAGKILSAHPVTRVRLRDRVPIDGSAWSRGHAVVRPRGGFARPRRLTTEQIEQAAIPSVIFDHLPGVDQYMNWRDFEDPLGALCIACVSYGRYRAGLPPLPALTAGPSG